MRYYLFLLVVAFCEAGRIRRGIDHTNLQAVYHGHGATSYQNVQIDNHNSIIVPTNYGDPEEIKGLEHHVYHQPIVPIVESHNDIEHYDTSDSVPYEEFTVADVKSDVFEHYFDHNDENYNYDFYL
nr:PREDICTED: uncharacterized protein LOC105674791 [Linepithema humile]